MKTDTLKTALKSLRLNKTLGLRRAAALLEVSPTHVHRMETGEELPSEALIGRYARALEGDRLELCRLAGIIPAEVRRYVLERPELLEQLQRKARAAAKQKRSKKAAA